MRWLLQCGLFFLVLRLDNALECYTCSSHLGIPNSMNECENFRFYENHRKAVCMPGDQVCAKWIVNHGGMNWVHRSCRPYDICNYLRQSHNNGRDQLLECTTCSDANLCNSAVTHSTSAGIVFLSLLMMYSLFMLY